MMEVTFTQEHMEYLLLILVRITSFVSLAPFFNQSGVPVRIKLGFSVFVSVLLYYVLPMQKITYNGVIEYATLILKESAAGMLLGFSTFICIMIIQFSGKLIDIEIGLSMAQIFDPTTKTQTSVVGSFYYYAFLLLMMVSNMHLYLLGAIVDSFTLIPIGGIRVGSTMYDTMLGFINNYFIIGFRLILPVFATTLLLNCILGIIAKVAPQMNMFVIGIQLKVIVGLVVIFVTISLIPLMSNFIFDQMKMMIKQMLQGMI